MLKLASGEFCAPAALEVTYTQQCELVRQIFVHGEMGAAFSLLLSWWKWTQCVSGPTNTAKT